MTDETRNEELYDNARSEMHGMEAAEPEAENVAGNGFRCEVQSEAADDVAFEDWEPEEEKKKRKRTKNAGREKGSGYPFGKFGTVLLMLCTALVFGFGGGILGSILSAQRMMDDITGNIEDYLSEAGAAVIYRSAETHTNGTKAGLDAVEVENLCGDSVVEIMTEMITDYGWFGKSLSEGAGSGVIISDDGYILTCNHVVAPAETISVALRNGETYEATLVGADEESDIAVIKIEAEGLTPAVLGDSSALQVGDPVVAIGNPLGHLGGTVTQGIISALARDITVEGNPMTLLQTDAAINGGNSGGGLFNARGELIGVVNAYSSQAEGLNFAVPINDAQQVVDDLITYGYVTFRVELGINMVQIDNDRTAMSYRVDELGVYILNVVNNSNAAFAGLQPGDRLVEIDGEEITSSSQVQDIIGSHIVGDVLHVVVERDDEIVEMDITLFGKVPAEEDGGFTPVSL